MKEYTKYLTKFDVLYLIKFIYKLYQSDYQQQEKN